MRTRNPVEPAAEQTRTVITTPAPVAKIFVQLRPLQPERDSDAETPSTESGARDAL